MDATYVTHAELYQFSLVIIGVVGLFIVFIKIKKRKK